MRILIPCLSDAAVSLATGDACKGAHWLHPPPCVDIRTYGARARGHCACGQHTMTVAQRQDARMPCWASSKYLSPGSDPGPANGLPGRTVRIARAKRTHFAAGGFSVLGYTSDVRG